MKSYPSPRMKRVKPLERAVQIRRHTVIAIEEVKLRRAPMLPLPLVPASERQRAKVIGRECLVCGRTPCDPAHIVPRKRGGCDHEDCVVPLCRPCHRAYDKRGFVLAHHLGSEFAVEIRHALGHTTPAGLDRGLAGGGWNPPGSDDEDDWDGEEEEAGEDDADQPR